MHPYNVLYERLLKIKKLYPLEVQEYNLIYGEVYYNSSSIHCYYPDYFPRQLTIFPCHAIYSPDSICCKNYNAPLSCEYKLDSKNRLIAQDKTKIRLSNKQSIQFLCRVCGYIPKNKFQILIPKTL